MILKIYKKKNENTPDAHSELNHENSQTLKAVNCFCKKLHPRHLTSF